MNFKTATLEVGHDGTLTIPDHILHELRLAPHQTVTVEVREDSLVLTHPREERLNRIGHLLRTALSDVEWSEIEVGRRDRCF